uniref:Uncharacterized protein n=2 Tax=Anguilla anguilla TaxID=7936 RepID=A0A0E9Q7V0_ANGAN
MKHGVQSLLPKVILPLMISGLFFMSLMAAIGSPQFATGPLEMLRHIVHKVSLNYAFSTFHITATLATAY